MKKKVVLVKVGQRTKAKFGEEIIKTIPKPFIDLVNHLGFIDVRVDKMTMTGEERLLLFLYKETEQYKDVPNYTGLENIEIIEKTHVKCRYSEDYYMVTLKNAPEIKIKLSQFTKLEIEQKEIKRWA